MTTIYEYKAHQIVKESIKSAIFIDEKAWMPYEEKSATSIPEEDLSNNLFTSFKENNISLAVHKFKKGDEENLEEYFFNGRDLVLLDWKLDNQQGEEYALKLLSEVVNKRHIHFCAIYTFNSNPEDVIRNILSYFSGEDESRYKEAAENLETDKSEILSIIGDLQTISFYRYDKEKVRNIRSHLKSKPENRELIKKITNEFDKENELCSLIKASVAFGDDFKSPIPQPSPELISIKDNILVINNTVILILDKQYDTDPKELLNRITDQIISVPQSFQQLLGLEMQTLLKKKGAFIDKNLIEVNRNTLLHHRKQVLESDLKTDLPFKDLIKDILFEHLKLGLSIESLNLLEDDVLNELSGELDEYQVENKELLKLNTFYNALRLEPENKNLNFGDVFLYLNGTTNEYYICITALCDCLRPEKIDNTFFFAKGAKMTDIEKAFQLGDTAFISFLSNGDVVRWSEIESIENEVAKFKPVYIKPIQIKVLNPIIQNTEMEVKQISKDGNSVETIKWEYITTIKPNYTQRISNHAFAHPVRVGVDFVKK